ncbi:unnamed protein product [Lactuca saligna]|uniref:Uncharacterized protein n=1 Tax=Lactuca saligna TaxID=75948 RepID=A0AA35Y742_LACSI|nr:unnamed protein product [Lactuca saligna]
MPGPLLQDQISTLFFPPLLYIHLLDLNPSMQHESIPPQVDPSISLTSPSHNIRQLLHSLIHVALLRGHLGMKYSLQDYTIGQHDFEVVMAHINHIVSMVEDTEDIADSPSGSPHDDQPSPLPPPPPTGNNFLALFQPPPPSNPHSPITYPPLNTPLGSLTHVDDSIKGEKDKGVVVYAYNYDDDDDD